MQLCIYNLELGSWEVVNYTDWLSLSNLECADTIASSMPFYGYYHVFHGTTDTTKDVWHIRDDKSHALRVYEDFQSLDAYGEKIIIPPADERCLNVNVFTPDYEDIRNTETVADELGGEDITLKLDDKIINMIFDTSGSMGWNDHEGSRYDLGERVINKLSSVYPGNINYSIFRFGGQPFNLIFGGVAEADFPATDLSCAADICGDSSSRFYGIRVVRKEFSYPSTPIDGDILFDGIADSFLDTGLELETTYYYSLFTFDKEGNFSDGIPLKYTTNGDTVPAGLSLASGNALVGSGVIIDGNVPNVWHFDEGYENNAYDFNASTDLSLFNHQWLNKADVPSGTAGVRFNGTTTRASSALTRDAVFTRDFTVMAWIKPYTFDGKKPIVYRQDNATNGWAVEIQNGTGRIQFVLQGATVGTSSFAVDLHEWNHIAVVVDGVGDGTFYINGISAGEFSISSANIDTNMFIDVGYDRIGDRYFFGEITEISIHDVARSVSYIAQYSSPASFDNYRDNGDRLVLIKGNVPDTFDYDTVEILGRVFRAPANEDDGTLIYTGVADTGEFYATYRENFVAGSTYYCRVFTKNSSDIYSHIYDSQKIDISIPIISQENRQLLGLVGDTAAIDLPSPTISSVLEDNGKIYIGWDIDELLANPDIIIVRIYVSTNGYPIVGDICTNGELVFEGDPSEGYFVHRDLIVGEDYYYTVIAIDRYGNFSEVANTKASPNGADSPTSLPLISIDSVSYEIKDENSVKIFWNDVLPSRDVQTFFDTRLALFAKLVDQYGEIITERDDVNVSLVVSGTTTMAPDAAPDVFLGETTVEDVSVDGLYKYAIEKLSSGITKGLLYLDPADSTILKNVESVNLTVRFKVSIADPENTSENLFEYTSSPVYARFANPLRFEFVNRDHKVVTKRCATQLAQLNSQFTSESIKYHGAYLNASEPFTLRAYLDFRNRQLDVSSTVSIAIHDATKDLCDKSTSPVDAGVSDTIVLVGSEFLVQQAVENVLDINGNPIGIKKAVSFIDIPINMPKTPQSVYVYVKFFFEGYGYVKRFFAVFESPLQIEVAPRVPIADGINQAEQYAVTYLIDGDDPQDASSRTYLNDIWMQWTLEPLQSNTPRKALSYTGDPAYDYATNLNEAYSYVTTGGSTKNVLIGPVQSVSIVDADSNGNPTFESHRLTASCAYSGYTASESYNLEFFPIGFEEPVPVSELTSDNDSTITFTPSDLYAAVTAAVGSVPGSPKWNNSLDLNGDGIIDERDQSLALQFMTETTDIQLSQQFAPGTSGSYMLMELPNYKQEFWTDGRSYAKMTVSHDPANSTTKYSDAFRGCVAAVQKDLVELSPGQSTLIYTNDSEIEIIWGDVIEYVDPYVGDWVLDTTNAFIATGYAFINLSDGNDTEVFFRVNRKQENKPVGFEKAYNSICEDFLGISSLLQYEKEVTVTGSTVALFDDNNITSTISLRGGGTINSGIIPTMLIPKEPLQIRVADRQADNVSTEAFVIDGLTSNEIVLDVSFAGRSVPDGTKVSVNIVNKYEDIITTADSEVETLIYTDPLIDPDNARSYATVTIRPIEPGRTFESQIFMTVKYDFSGEVKRSETLCVTVSNDAEKSLPDSSVTTINTIFSKRLERCDLAPPPDEVVWTSRLDMNHPRGHLVTEVVGTKLYAIGGIDGSEISGVVERYNHTTNEWKDKSVMPTKRMMSMSVQSGGEIYVVGGIGFDFTDNKVVVSNAVERYDPTTDSWEHLADMPDINLGGPDNVSYGVAGGTAQLIDNKIYILSGVREISSDGTVVDYNDRILAYDIGTDLWWYSDAITSSDLDNYFRVFPTSFRDGFNIQVMGGTYQDSVTNEYIANTYSYDVLGGVLSHSEWKLDILPDFRNKATCVSNGDLHYIIGGIDSVNNIVKTCEEISHIGGPDPDYLKQYMTDIPKGRNGVAAAVIRDLGVDYLYIVGGIESGKGNNFLQVFVDIFDHDMFLNHEQSIGIKIRLLDDSGEIPSGNITLLLDGYLQFSDIETGKDFVVEDELVANRVVFDPQEVTVSDGVGYARLISRHDDYIAKLLENVSFTMGEQSLRYKIIVQGTVTHGTYYGQNFVYNTADRDQVVIVDDSNCVPGASNLEIDSLATDNESAFDLLSNPLAQQEPQVVNCYSDIAWIPIIENMTPNGIVSASSAKNVIDTLRLYDDIGGSPFYDALVDSSKFLMDNESYIGTEKMIYAFTDKEPNCSINSLDEAAIEVNAIDRVYEVPVVIANLALGTGAVIPSLFRKTDFPLFNLLTNKTDSQGVTISSNDINVINDAVFMLTGAAKGSLGFGESTFVFDFGESVILQSAAVNYQLFTNTNGRWRMSVSVDGYNYSDYSIFFKPNNVSFFNSPCRYVRFDMELYSGLSIGNEEPYEDIPTGGVPTIRDIDICYKPQQIEYIYADAVDGEKIDQLVIATNSNSTHDDAQVIYGGVSSTEWSHNWDDFQSGAQPAVEDSGRIVVPTRRGTAAGERIEPLENTDGYLFKAPNGRWGSESTVTVYVVSGGLQVTVNSSKYKTIPRDGVVIFNENRNSEGQHYINILKKDSYRLGLQLVNNEEDNLELYGVARMHNEEPD